MTREEMIEREEECNEVVNDYMTMTLDGFCDKYHCFEWLVEQMVEEAKKEIESLERSIENYDDEELRIYDPYEYYGVSEGMFY